MSTWNDFHPDQIETVAEVPRSLKVEFIRYPQQWGGFMNISDIVLAIDAEITQLQKVKALLTDTDTTVKRKLGRPAFSSSPNKTTSFNSAEFAEKPAKRRTMSAEGRAKIAAAQKARWAKSKKTAKRATRKASTTSAEKTAVKTVTRKVDSRKKIVTENKPALPKSKTSVTFA